MEQMYQNRESLLIKKPAKKKKKKNFLLGAAKKLLLNKKNKSQASIPMKTRQKQNQMIQKILNP